MFESFNIAVQHAFKEFFHLATCNSNFFSKTQKKYTISAFFRQINLKPITDFLDNLAAGN
ncbi:hypothetical protein NG99_05255 [Erwinia typographi]|uniref:Uncharacterized protein n=1 Tax=Erwinia typographi TaxID=371042 RepID=A0A0A4AB44_9GAMM|nr:hypothetical protein NG99_05255 [Erwinia typographi]